MADYIYLMQNRLSAPQRRALEAVREAARAQGMPVFLVGGAVRDLTTGTPVRDLDFALQGDAHALREDLEGRGGTVAGENTTLGSVYLTFSGGVRVEVGPTVSVSYPKPGQAEVRTASILDDLRRRDFTANAMAVSLNEGSYGLLLDPLNGIADLENHELRLSSAYGFIEQPSLLLRAARLTERLGWSKEERTATRYETSKEEDHIQALPAADKAYELEEIFHEEDAATVLAHMETEGWLAGLAPFLRPADADRSGLDAVSELLGRMEGRGLHADPSAVNFPLVTAKMTDAQRAELKRMFARPGFARQIDGMEARAKELAGQLTSKTAGAPSEVWHLLMNADPEVVLALASTSRSAAVQGKIKAFLNEWPQMRGKIPYAILQEMRITPDLAGYDALLDDIFFALIDGKLPSDEAIRAFLEPHSPPAPPQVQVRRRPAKATRSRAGKKTAATVASSSASEDDDATDSDTESPSVGTAATEPAELKVAKPTVAATSKKTAKASEAKPAAAPKLQEAEAEPTSAAVTSAAPAAAAKAPVAPAKKTPTPVGKEAKTSPAKSHQPTNVKPKVTSQPAKSAPVKVVAVKAPAKAVVTKSTTPTKQQAAPTPKKAAAPKAAPEKAAAKSAASKTAAAKPAPNKAAAKKTVSAKKTAKR